MKAVVHLLLVYCLCAFIASVHLRTDSGGRSLARFGVSSLMESIQVKSGKFIDIKEFATCAE